MACLVLARFFSLIISYSWFSMSQILLIEPDRVLAVTYKKSFESAGHSVDIASSAQAAITAADNIKPDAVILELQLINHSGIEFLYEFRSYDDWRKVPVIILSNIPLAEFDGSHDLLVRELGVETYLYKPTTSIKRLLSVINQSKVLA